MMPGLCLSLLAALQVALQVSDSTYSSPGVRELVEAAAARHRVAERRTARYASEIESEIGLLLVAPNGEQILTGVEQVAGRVTWSNRGRLVQSLTAYRSRFAGPALSTLTYIRGPWVVGPLVGDRVPLALAADSARPSDEEVGRGEAPAPEGEATDASGRTRKLPVLVSPLASDREAFYRLSGGDTVLTLRLPDRTIPVVRVAVEPIGAAADVFLLRGEIHLDAVDHGVVRLRGEVLRGNRPGGVLSRMMRAAVQGHFFLDLENGLGDLGDWLPHRQWVELEVGSLLTDQSAVLRFVTDFAAATLDSAPPVPDDDPRDDARRALLVVGADPGGGPSGWRAELGSATAERDSRDLTDLRSIWARAGVRPGTRRMDEAVRYDRVEGLFTGAGLRMGAGTGARGPYAAVHAGWAWAERTARGGMEVGLAGSRWDVAVGAERDLAPTTDFPRPFESRPTIFGVFGYDPLDYVDRYAAGLRASFRPPAPVAVRAHVRAVADREPALNAERGLLGARFRPLRAVAEGEYVNLGVGVALHEGRGGEFLAPGWNAAASWELARGDLSWQRIQGSLRARRLLGRWSGAGEVFGGLVVAEDPPPQALFELGGYLGRLPGFALDAFTGDRAAVGMVEAAYDLPILESPIRIGPLFLPSVSPSPLAQVSAGWTHASRNASAVLRAHGWETSDGVRATGFLGVRLFGGFLRVGAARPLGARGRWRLEIGLGQSG